MPDGLPACPYLCYWFSPDPHIQTPSSIGPADDSRGPPSPGLYHHARVCPVSKHSSIPAAGRWETILTNVHSPVQLPSALFQ